MNVIKFNRLSNLVRTVRLSLLVTSVKYVVFTTMICRKTVTIVTNADSVELAVRRILFTAKTVKVASQ